MKIKFQHLVELTLTIAYFGLLLGMYQMYLIEVDLVEKISIACLMVFIGGYGGFLLVEAILKRNKLTKKKL